MDALIQAIEAPYLKKNLPAFRIGDTIRVHQRIREGGKERIQVFEGLVIAQKHSRGMDGTFTVRRIASGVGVERVFPLHSPMIAKIERMRSAKVRRAKLYFLRGRVGKRARLKGIETYASWTEPTTEELASGEGDEEIAEAPVTSKTEQSDAQEIPQTTENSLVSSKPVESTGESTPETTVEPDKDSDGGPTEGTGESRGEPGHDAASEEGASDPAAESNK